MRPRPIDVLDVLYTGMVQEYVNQCDQKIMSALDTIPQLPHNPLMSTEDLLSSLRAIAATLGDDVSTLTERVLTYPGFTTWTGSIENRHHYGEGGLLKHTHEVVGLCMVNQRYIEATTPHKLNARVLFLAALCHDWGKIKDYSQEKATSRWVEEMSAERLNAAIEGRPAVPPPREWTATPHHRHIHHITRSALLWSRAVAETGLCKEIEDEVIHCILSHHGSADRGSPVFPQTREAWVLHLCDSTSAWMDGVGKMDPKP